MALLTAPTIRISSKSAPVGSRSAAREGWRGRFRRGLLLDPRRVDEVGRAQLLRVHDLALAAVSPLREQERGPLVGGRAGLDVVRVVELDGAGNADVARLLE